MCIQIGLKLSAEFGEKQEVIQSVIFSEEAWG